jgi:hypothetical protein
MSGSSRGREMRRDIADELDRLGIRRPEFGFTNGSHQFVEFDTGGRRHRYVFPFTPSDWRAGRKALSGLRRLVREASPR